MSAAPIQEARPRLVIAGATGLMGTEMLRQLAGCGAFAHTQVLAREPIRTGLRGVDATIVPCDEPAEWPKLRADVAVVLFDPPRMYYERERALWTPQPRQLPALARWLRESGVETLAVVLPHDQGRLPEALKRGLASMDEQAVAALHFERLIIVRSPRKPSAPDPASLFARVAQLMLSILRYMVPASEQPVRAAKVAQLVAFALRSAPPGIHIAAPELVWRAGQGTLAEVAGQWLAPRNTAQ
ncbi:MAG TPA: hypothetical protein VHA82_23555 [Ramlibacter sp.]|uniref:hypothetical protein n=1 Tax=Ramlibacter sp. TaxID=1917967 RepID=UPI002B98B524|nr:hypothetical protein [Ramlibacter sp.]HVZ46803.1 hypothetical protein [Ramlibacter sp.]